MTFQNRKKKFLQITKQNQSHCWKLFLGLIQRAKRFLFFTVFKSPPDQFNGVTQLDCWKLCNCCKRKSITLFKNLKTWRKTKGISLVYWAELQKKLESFVGKFNELKLQTLYCQLNTITTFYGNDLKKLHWEKTTFTFCKKKIKIIIIIIIIKNRNLRSCSTGQVVHCKTVGLVGRSLLIKEFDADLFVNFKSNILMLVGEFLWTLTRNLWSGNYWLNRSTFICLWVLSHRRLFATLVRKSKVIIVQRKQQKDVFSLFFSVS